MASNACKYLCLLIFFAFVSQGYGCETTYLTLKQSKTGKTVENKPEWEVTLTNPCSCVFLNVKLSCAGFQSVVPIESSVLSKSGDECLVNDGGRIDNPGQFVFKYVWDTSFDLKIASATIACS